jgi:hypothetical protein
MSGRAASGNPDAFDPKADIDRRRISQYIGPWSNSIGVRMETKSVE